MRECGKISKPRISRHARFWVASSGFRTLQIFIITFSQTCSLNVITELVQSENSKLSRSEKKSLKKKNHCEYINTTIKQRFCYLHLRKNLKCMEALK